MNNNWIDVQNSQDAISTLAASDSVWAKVQSIRAVQLAVIVALPIVLTISSEFFPKIVTIASFISVVLALLDVMFLAPNLERRRKIGAQLQDRFDAIVFDLRRSRARELDDPNVNQIRELAELQPAKRAMRNLNWYSPALGELPKSIGRIACMFESATWDFSLRQKWIITIRVMLFGSLIGFAGCIVLVPITGNTLLELAVVPLLPLFIWLLRELSEQRSACEYMTEITTGLGNLWATACTRQPNAADLEDGALELTQTFRSYRALMSPVPHWLYMLRRPFQHKLTMLAADDRIRQYEAAMRK